MTVDPYIVSVDSTLLRARDHVWHKSSMAKGTATYPGMDTDARWGKSRSRGWLFGYKLHVVSSTGSLIVPLSAEFTTANIPDSKVYGRVTASLSSRRQACGRGRGLRRRQSLRAEQGERVRPRLPHP